MTLRPQGHPFPPIHLPEISWITNLRKSMELLAPGEGVWQGLELGLPKASGLVTTGLKPTLTDGYLLRGDEILGPYGSKQTETAEAGWTNKKIYFGRAGMAYGDANNAPLFPNDALIGSLSTNSANPASIVHLGQQLNYGAGRFGVRGVVNLAACPKGADTTFFRWEVPQGIMNYARVTYAQARITEAVSAGNTAGDDFVLKVKQGSETAVSLATIASTSLVTAGTVSRKVPVSADALSWYKPVNIDFIYNQTDTSTAIAGGEVEVMVVLEMF